MSDFKKPSGFGGNRNKPSFGRGGSGRPSFGGKPNFRSGGGRDGERKEMFTAVCDECHKSCEVPFRPTGSRPVYCKDCFSGKRDSSDEGFQRRESPSRDFPRKDFSTSFSSSQSPRPQADDKKIDELKRQIEALHVKMDRLLKAAGDTSQTEEYPEETTTEPFVIEASEKPAKEAKKASPKKKPTKAKK